MMDLGFWATEQNMEWSGWTIFGGVGSRIYIVKSAFLIFWVFLSIFCMKSHCTAVRRHCTDWYKV